MIILILTATFLSQQVYFSKVGDNIVSGAVNNVTAQVSKGFESITSRFFPNLAGEAEKRGEIIQDTVVEQKNNLENSLEETKNYFSGIKNSIVNPDVPQNCPDPAASAN